MIEQIKWTLKLYSLTTVLPITLSIGNIILCGIFGVESIHGFWMNFKIIWIDYYFTGSFCEIDAWRWQLGLFFFAFIFTIFGD